MPEFVRFLVVGGMATGLQYVLLGAATALLGWTSAAGSAVGYAAGSMLSYALNYLFTFRSDARHMQAIPRFYAMVGLGLVLNTSVMAFLADYWGWDVWLSQVVATMLTLFSNFVLSRRWVFKARKT